jgi:hypothetical protein
MLLNLGALFMSDKESVRTRCQMPLVTVAVRRQFASHSEITG